MDPAHEDILRRNRTKIVKVLDVARVKDSLIEHRIFDSDQWEQIEKSGAGTERGKASALMDKLPRSGPKAFWGFCESLMTGGYDFLGKLLIEEATLRGQITRIRDDYRKCLSRGKGETVLKAFNNVVHCIKTRGNKESEQKITSLKHLKDAPKSDRFDKSNESILIEIQNLVEELKNIKEHLAKCKAASEHVNALRNMLADRADFSDLYNRTVKEGSDYLKEFGMQGIESSSKSRFGSVLVLIPYLCDLSEKAIQTLKQPSTDPADDFSSSGGEGKEAAMGAEKPVSHEYADAPRGNDTMNQTILEEVRKLSQKQDQMKDELMKAIKLKDQIQEIKAIFSDVSGHLKDNKEVLTGQSVVVAKVSDLERKVQNLRDQPLDMSDMVNLVEEIEEIQKEAGNLRALLTKDWPEAIALQLENIDQILKDVLSKIAVAQPGVMTIAEVIENSISVTWAEAPGAKDSYSISISPATGVTNPIGSVDAGATLEYTFTGLTAGTLYTISVVTVSGRVNSVARTETQRTDPETPVGRIVRNINAIREEYKEVLKMRKLTLFEALKKVAKSKLVKSQSSKLGKSQSSKASSVEKVTSLKDIKDFLKDCPRKEQSPKKQSPKEQSPKEQSLDEEQWALRDILGLVEKLKHIRNELKEYRPVHGLMTELNSKLAEKADFSTLYDEVENGRGLKYVNDFELDWVAKTDMSKKVGSALVLIPYLCDISEQAVREMKTQSSKAPSGAIPKKKK